MFRRKTSRRTRAPWQQCLPLLPLTDNCTYQIVLYVGYIKKEKENGVSIDCACFFVCVAARPDDKDCALKQGHDVFQRDALGFGHKQDDKDPRGQCEPRVKPERARLFVVIVVVKLMIMSNIRERGHQTWSGALRKQSGWPTSWQQLRDRSPCHGRRAGRSR